MAAEREMKKVEDLTPQEREELRRFRDRLKSEDASARARSTPV